MYTINGKLLLERKRRRCKIIGKLLLEDSISHILAFVYAFLRGEKVLDCYSTSPLCRLSTPHIVLYITGNNRIAVMIWNTNTSHSAFALKPTLIQGLSTQNPSQRRLFP